MWSLDKLEKQCQCLLPLLYQVHCCAFKGKKNSNWIFAKAFYELNSKHCDQCRLISIFQDNL
jgi:predicted  nucleic acid-binding Zn ribbon protein